MGNKHSKVTKTPYEILGLDTTSTRHEIKTRYKQLIIKIHPDTHKNHAKDTSINAAEVNEAYNILMKSPPVFEAYTQELFKQDVRKYAGDFFERVANYCKITNYPRFDDPGFEQFYYFFTNFRAQAEFETEQEQNTFCLNVRKIARMVRSIDKRMDIVLHTTTPSFHSSLNKQPRCNTPKVYPFNCNECSKGFHCRNQLLNHLNSKKHLIKISTISDTPGKYIQEQIAGIITIHPDTQAPVNPDNQTTTPSDTDTPSSVLNEANQSDHQKPKKSYKREPVAFRTCSKCKLILDGREDLLLHMKANHQSTGSSNP
ncbi:hypothetical protein CWI42_010460 [Ordospora colligata]|nr:hypothetical protein CWI42_010460 [Ordospora colligata]